MDNWIFDILGNVDKFEVYEDNGGGLSLAIWHDGNFYCHCGYEYNQGQLTEDLALLADGADPAVWDNMQDMDEEEWKAFVGAEYGGKVIIDKDGFYKSSLGASGAREFSRFLTEE